MAPTVQTRGAGSPPRCTNCQIATARDRYVAQVGYLAESAVEGVGSAGYAAGVGVIDEAADSVLLAVATIPEGRVTTYGAIGRIVGYGPRLVARVLATRGGDVCWWRVIRADGSIAPHLVEQATKQLEAEGVEVRRGVVNLREYGA